MKVEEPLNVKEIKILDTAYQFFVGSEGLEQQNLDGVCRCYSKQIQLRPMDKMLGPLDSMEDKRTRFCEVLRHELIHAFFFEAGLGDYCDDETLVDWLARMVPKLVETFQEEGCLPANNREKGAKTDDYL